MRLTGRRAFPVSMRPKVIGVSSPQGGSVVYQTSTVLFQHRILMRQSFQFGMQIGMCLKPDRRHNASGSAIAAASIT